MKNIDNITLNENSKISDALRIIDSGAMKIALVVDNTGKLLGTLTDGDIRRGLLQGLTLDDGIKPVIFKTPTTAHINETRENILQKALDKKLLQIPIVDDHQLLVGLEVLDDLIRVEGYENKVVLMVGGLGTRLSPLTDTIPKPLLRVGDKPILETIIKNFVTHGFKNIILSVNYKANMIEEYFGDGSELGASIEYIHEENQMGTAGALSLMREKLTEPFFVMNGDLLTNINFDHMYDYHRLHNADATMAVRKYDFQVPYGVVNVSGHSVTSIEEKPIHEFFVSGGIYILDHSVLKYIPDGVFFDMPTLFEKMIDNDNEVVSFPIREYWLDIGRIEEYDKANKEYYGIFDV